MECVLKMGDVSVRLVNLLGYMSSEKLLESGRLYVNAFTRKSPLNFLNMLLLLINNHGRTNTVELRSFFKSIKSISVSKQAFSEARQKLNPKVFKKINNYYLDDIYSNNNMKTFKGYLLFGVDGSKFDLPTHKSIIKIFGGIKSKFRHITSAKGNMSMIYDVLNKFIPDLEINKYKTSEKILSQINFINIESLNCLSGLKKIFIFDRGYPSIEFFSQLMEKNEKFVFRIKNKSYKREKSKMRKKRPIY